MPACHVSCLVMLAMRSCSRSSCSAELLCYRTRLLSLSQMSRRLVDDRLTFTSLHWQPPPALYRCRRVSRWSTRINMFTSLCNRSLSMQACRRHMIGREEIGSADLSWGGLCVSCPMGNFGPPQWPASVRAARAVADPGRGQHRAHEWCPSGRQQVSL